MSILSKAINKFFIRVRTGLSKNGLLYALVGGVSVILFWRGVWHTADILEQKGSILGVIFSGPGSFIIASIVLIVTGLFVSAFIGDRIILAGIQKEKNTVQKTEQELEIEENELRIMHNELHEIQEEIEEIRDTLHEEVRK